MSSASTSEKKSMVTLMSKDEKKYEVEEAVAAMSATVRYVMEADCAEQVIPCSNVTGDVLAMVIDYCKKHVEMGVQVQEASEDETKKRLEKELREWDAKFIDLKQHVLYDLLLAANYLCIESLLDLATQRVADMIKGRTPDEIREIFRIKNDFTPEEEEEIKRENSWAFER